MGGTIVNFWARHWGIMVSNQNSISTQTMVINFFRPTHLDQIGRFDRFVINEDEFRSNSIFDRFRNTQASCYH